MDRSLRLRTIALIGILLFCVHTLAPTFIPGYQLPSWASWFKSKRINYGLDLQGGKHIVYNIALDKAVDDKAFELKRDIEARITDEKIGAIVRTPPKPLGAVTVLVADASKDKQAKLVDEIHKDYGNIIKDRECTVDACKADADCNQQGEICDVKNQRCVETGRTAVCFVVSQSYADGIKKAALTNAVSTIRDRINAKGVAESSVVEKGDDIIVEIPGDPKSQEVTDIEELIARTAKLEMKVVDDCNNPGPSGCTKDASHGGSPYMSKLFAKVGSDRKGNPSDPEAIRLEIRAEVDGWQPDEGGARHTDYYLLAPDHPDESVPVAWAKKRGCIQKDSVIENGKTRCPVTGRQIIERYLFGDKELGYVGLAEKDPTFKLSDDHQIGYELEEPLPGAKDQTPKWRTFYLERAVRLTGSGISDAMPSYDPNTNAPIVLLDFNRFGGRVFGDVTSQIVGMKFATILDDNVKSAPIINGAITGGRASITLGRGNDAVAAEKAQKDLVAVLKTGSLPAPLEKASESDVGPTLGRDAIDKTKLSFELGILLVIMIMVGIYRWSGWISVFAVVFHILMTLAVMAIFGATLTLPGIAAIVLSIGMEVDGNILIYERIRDELLLGKSVRGAIDLGFSRAFSAILDGQLTTAAAAWVLLQYGTGPIKGFAVMLLVGVFTTLTTNIWVTRILFDWTVARKKGQIQTLSI